MSTGFTQICRLIAASGYRDRDIEGFASRLMQMGPEMFMAQIRDIRRSFAENSSDHDLPSLRYVTTDIEVADKIERLLVLETGLPRSKAIELFSQEIAVRFPETLIPSESRKGFYAWIKRLMSLLPEKELLHIATIIRNRFVHERPHDWRLK